MDRLADVGGLSTYAVEQQLVYERDRLVSCFAGYDDAESPRIKRWGRQNRLVRATCVRQRAIRATPCRIVTFAQPSTSTFNVQTFNLHKYIFAAVLSCRSTIPTPARISCDHARHRCPVFLGSRATPTPASCPDAVTHECAFVP